MNVLILEDTASSEKGGAEKSMRYFSEFLSIQNNVNLYLVYHNAGNLTVEPNINIYKGTTQIQLYSIKQVGFSTYLKNIYSFIKYCRKMKIDIIFTHVIHAFFILRISKYFAKFKHFQYFKWTPSTPHIGFLGGWGIKGVNQAFAVSTFTMNYWCNLNPNFIKTNVIPDGIPEIIDFDNCTFNPYKNSAVNLLFAGRIYHGKGLHILIEAMQYCKNKNVVLNVCGTFESDDENNEYKHYIYSLIDKLNLNENIIFHGFQKKLLGFIKYADLVVVPSVAPDAQPLILLEAMRHGTICIGSNEGGIPEILINELTQLVFPSNDSIILANKIDEFLSLDDEIKSSLSAKLIHRFENRYTLINTNKILFSQLNKLKNE